MRKVFPLCLVFCGISLHALPPIPGVQNHWVANSGGNPWDHIQNFIEEMTVKPDGTVLTQSFWDEAQHPDAKYKDGRSVGFNWEKDSTNPHPSRRAVSKGVTWNIRNFWGRAFLGKVFPPPKDSLPWIESSDGRSIKDLVDPTAIAFDNLGRLMVADNGPDQNIKFFDVSSEPKIVATFGDLGGVFAGPVRGATGDKRFWGLRGVGMDSLGRLYVGNTGMPMQVGGGTDIRCFSGAGPRDTLVWRVLGLAFVNTVDADPDSGGTSLHKNSTRFHMDWSKPPGQSWSFAAATTDPFKYPDDPRLVHSLESVWFRRIEGKRFLFLDDMYGNFLAVTRFEENSKIKIPTAFLPIGSALRDTGAWDRWAVDKRPHWPAVEGDDRRWIWRDDNADGQVQKGEFHEYELAFPYTRGIDIDDAGDIWWGGGSYMVQFPTGGLDENGVPRYPVDKIRRWKVPFKVRSEENNNYVMYLRYLRDQDAMIVATGRHEGLIANLYRYDHWSRDALPFLGWGPTANSEDTLVHTWKIEVPYKFPEDWSKSLDGRVMDTCLFPNNLTADSQYVYVGYVDKGPHAWRNGEITVYDAHTGKGVGWIAPGPETNFTSGWFDLWHALNSYTMPSGEKLLMAEEDYAGKVNVYKWCPTGICRPPPPRVVGGTSLRSVGRTLVLDAPEGAAWTVSLRDLRGRLVWSAQGTGTRSWTDVPFRGLCYASVGGVGVVLMLP
ncbi:MAG: hypothetical protein IPK50_19815 [Fibrobacterota bacterium]|nr:MAG: hypothetical protein IPK50_19815 [Fibrobacterota bacterium]